MAPQRQNKLGNDFLSRRFQTNLAALSPEWKNEGCDVVRARLSVL